MFWIDPNSQYFKEGIMEIVRETFRPEFINRLDEIIIFHHLFRNQMDAIVTIQLDRLRERLALQNIGLVVEQSALTLLADLGYNQVYGARPLKRAIQRYLENPMAQLILEDKIRAGEKAKVSAKQNRLTRIR